MKLLFSQSLTPKKKINANFIHWFCNVLFNMLVPTEFFESLLEDLNNFPKVTWKALYKEKIWKAVLLVYKHFLRTSQQRNMVDRQVQSIHQVMTLQAIIEKCHFECLCEKWMSAFLEQITSLVTEVVHMALWICKHSVRSPKMLK